MSHLIAHSARSKAVNGKFEPMNRLVTNIFYFLGVTICHLPRTKTYVNLIELENQLHTQWMQSIAGDRKSYAQLLENIGGHLRSFFKRRLMSRPSEVEDLVQETLLAIHQKRHTYLEGQPLTAWIFAIARYKFIDSVRAYAVRDALHDTLDDVEEELWSEQDKDEQEARHDMTQLLNRLPVKQRDAILQVKLHGLSIAEAAQVLNQSESAVKIHIHRGIKTLSLQNMGKS